MPVADDGSWSSQVLAEIHEKVVITSPIPVANACGLGASSCYKCHNGKRAALPSTKPWHVQHAKVNHSCVGCHNGNERLMIESMAHKDLVPDPRTNPEKFCMDCHKDGDLQTLLGNYQKSQ
jgi:nitrate/TMAO reductase-like tetraheme cytochrome c subunit